MKKIILLILSVSFFIPAKNFAQDNNMNNRRFIEVTGVNEMEIVPDEITLLISLVESKENGSIQKQEEALKSSVKELGIDLANLTLNSANADYQRTRILKKEVVVTKSYLLKISSADMVGKVFEKLDKINASDAYILTVNHTKMTEFKKESRIKAIKAAKEKVDYLLAAVGEKAGQPIQINEVEMYTPVYANAMFKSKAGNYDQSGGDELSFKKIKINSNVMVKYEILNK